MAKAVTAPVVESKGNPILRNRLVSLLYARRFLRIFGVPLKKYFPDNATGFDVIKFDDEVVKSGKGVMADVVMDRWGNEALNMVQALVRPPSITVLNTMQNHAHLII